MDPTYPLVPVLNLIAAFLILLTAITTARQTWNTGVLMLCGWIFITNLIQGFETVIWSNDADNKAPGWCDISSHLGVAVLVGVPACSLVITRRLCNIATLRSIETPGKRERRKELLIELLIGLGLPVLVMGPLYYIVQAARFEVVEEVGCSGATALSGLTTLLLNIWPVLLPLISAIFYCPRILWIFFHHNREINAFLQSNASIDRNRYFRVLAIGCLDIMFNLPTGALFLAENIGRSVATGSYPFYPGWYATHQFWTPFSVSAADWRSEFWNRFQILYQEFLFPAFSVMIFAIFGLTGEARATYRSWFWTAAGVLGVEPRPPKNLPETDISFGSFANGMHELHISHDTLLAPFDVADGFANDTHSLFSAEQDDHIKTKVQGQMGLDLVV